MNVVREINKINERELELGASASWHDEYKDSAYIFIGGLHFDLTEGDVITIFSQYGEVMDVNLPRDKTTGKTKGFGFLMYEDQRSTVIAIDNLNGANVLEKTLRVDHVKNYKQPKVKGEDGEWVEPEEQSLNAKPGVINDQTPASDSDVSSAFSIDPEDPMRDYLMAQRKEMKALKKSKKSKDRHKDETPEERRTRKERKRERKLRKDKTQSEAVKGVEDLLKTLERRHRPRDERDTPDRDREHLRDQRRSRSPPYRRRDSRFRSRSPGKNRDTGDVRMRSRTPERDMRRPGPSRHSDDDDDDDRHEDPRVRTASYRDRRDGA
ncbi:RNA-binding domain-containing protein [Gyrodon lividus]|nr:RNA-binding domain-containing protein [Gyrodon lividus]